LGALKERLRPYLPDLKEEDVLFLNPGAIVKKVAMKYVHDGDLESALQGYELTRDFVFTQAVLVLSQTESEKLERRKGEYIQHILSSSSAVQEVAFKYIVQLTNDAKSLLGAAGKKDVDVKKWKSGMLENVYSLARAQESLEFDRSFDVRLEDLLDEGMKIYPDRVGENMLRKVREEMAKGTIPFFEVSQK